MKDELGDGRVGVGTIGADDEEEGEEVPVAVMPRMSSM